MRMNSVVLAAAILCQNALDGNLQRGSGTALDRGLQQGSRVNAPTGQQDYRSRNLVVTGNVAGGREFRGSVGYSGESDFRGATAGDSTQKFRSNADLTSMESLSSIPMNDRFGVATGIGAVGYRRDYATTQGAGVPNATELSPGRGRVLAGEAAIAENSSRVRLDLMTGSSGTRADLSSLSQPMTMAVVPLTNNRQARVIASLFNGVVAVPGDDMVESLSLGVYSSALMRADLRTGRADSRRIAQSYLAISQAKADESATANTLGSAAARAAAARLDTKVQPGQVGAKPPKAVDGTSGDSAGVLNAYDKIAQGLSSRYQKLKGGTATDSAPETESVSAAVKAIRDGFALSTRSPDESGDRSVAPEGGESQVSTDGEKPATGERPADAARDGDESKRRPTRKLTADEAFLLMSHGDAIQHLSGQTKDALDTMLGAGESSMRNGHYMSAERAYVTAAAIAPANPLPLIGLASSRIAAGLEVSASIAIKQLALTYPETLGAHYDLALLGSAQRIRAVGDAALKRGSQSRNKDDYGLVAAFIGYQLGDRQMTQAGLALMDSIPESAPLAKALRGVWLIDPAKVGATGADAEPQSK